jgi:hypothetical protein
VTQSIIEAAFLNIVASPHPEGVYKRLLKKAARQSINYWGSYYAAYTNPVDARDDSGLLTFTLYVWVEVNPDEPAINKAELLKADFPKEGREFTKRYGVNGRSFSCAFDPEVHLLTVEIKNEEGKRISIDMVRRIFEGLLSPRFLGKNAEDVAITVVPTDNAVAYVLEIDRLDRVEIFVRRPNQDDLTSETNALMRELIEENAKSERRILIRQPQTDGLQLNNRNLSAARVGARNGYVEASGVETNGERVTRSTQERPRIVRHVVAVGASFVAALRAIAREAREQHEQL